MQREQPLEHLNMLQMRLKLNPWKQQSVTARISRYRMLLLWRRVETNDVVIVLT